MYIFFYKLSLLLQVDFTNKKKHRWNLEIINTVFQSMLKPDNLVCFQCLFARRVVHEKEETTEREEEDDEEDKSSDEGLLLQAHHAMERMEEFVHKVRGSSSSLTHTHLFHSSVNRCALSLSLYVEGRTVRLNAWHQHTWPELSAHSCFYTNTPQSTNTEDNPVKPDAHLLAPAASHLNLV